MKWAVRLHRNVGEIGADGIGDSGKSAQVHAEKRIGIDLVLDQRRDHRGGDGLTSYQSLGRKAGVERVSPLASTLPEDCKDQPSRRESVASGWGWLESCATIRPEKDSTTMHNRLRWFIFIKRSFAGKLIFKGVLENDF